jgi:PAS domain S-box-containing protein
VKKISFSNWFKNISIAKKLYFTVGIMATLIAIELVVLIFSINTLSSVRAYVTGEGLWSKAQKDAMFQLLKYGDTHNDKDYIKFKEFMKVPLGDRKTLLELNKKNPDMEIARQGFIEGRNHPDDVEGMINLFSRFNNVSYIKKAIYAWTKADALASEIIPIGEKLHNEINSKTASQETINKILLEIDPVNEKVTIWEDEFSYTLGEGSRWLENLILKLLFSVSLTVELTGLILAIIVSRGIQKGLNEILLSAKAVSKGDFSRHAIAFSQDEIGMLANNFNTMSEELKKSIREIELAHKKFKGLLESAPDGIVILGEEGVIHLVNKQCETIFGYSKEDLIGNTIDILLPKQNSSKDQEEHTILFSNPRIKLMSTSIELQGVRKNGDKFPVEISLSPLETDEGILISMAIRDISERSYIKELENKNRELEQFAYISSHDLQEPLNSIISIITMLEESYLEKLDDDGIKYLKYIDESSHRMKDLITDLLEYSRIGHSGKPEPINCNEIIGSVIADIKAKIDDNNATINVTADLPVVKGYQLEVRLLFQNLLSNGIKFRKRDVDPVINLYVEDREQHFQFTIEDNGIGIEQRYLEKIFIIFQRLNNREQYEGTGIGLAHCQKIVELHGGKIWVESKVGEGSKFHFTWPKPKQDNT